MDGRFGRNREDELFVFIVKAAKSVVTARLLIILGLKLGLTVPMVEDISYQIKD